MWRHALLALALASTVGARAAHAGPAVTLGVDGVAGGMTTISSDDSPTGRAAGAGVAVGTPVGRRAAVVLRVGWVTMRDRDVRDPFDDPRHDYRIHWLEASVAYQQRVGSGGWLGVRAGLGHYWELELGAGYPHDVWGGTETAIGVRFGWDVYRRAGDAVALFVDGETMIGGLGPLPVHAATGLFGVEYRRDVGAQ